MDRKKLLSRAKRIVVKVGTSSITEDLVLSDRKVSKIVGQVEDLLSQGHDAIIVSSGSIGAGIKKLGLAERPRDMNMLQACAAVGQNELMRAYGKAFARHGRTVAQILLTRDDFKSRKRYLNIRNTVNTLIKARTVPIINENDSVAVEEICFGDNDSLSANVASNMDADLLIMMSSMDGLFDRDPARSRDAEKIEVVESISCELAQLSGKSRMGGVGGIQSKIKAGDAMMRCGIPMAIVNAEQKDVLKRLMSGEPVGTVFIPKKRMENKLQWMLFACKVRGRIMVDAGAAKVLAKGGVSLLPAGVTGTEGQFKAGEPVAVIGPKMTEICRGISNFSKDQVDEIKGMQTKKVRELLGQGSKKEIIHSENIVVIGR